MGVLQARILEWVVMPSSRGSSQGSNLRLLCLLHCRQTEPLLLSHESSPSPLTSLCFFLVLASTNTTGKHSCIPVITNLELFSPQERFSRARFKDQKPYIHQMVHAARSSPKGPQNLLLPSRHERTL